MSYIDDFGRELRVHGIRGTRRCRILAEVIDHLEEDPTAEERFGSPAEVANAFAAELGAQASRRAAITAFASLGIAGLVYAAALVALGFAGPPTDMFGHALGAFAFGMMIVAPQVAFVSGSLALVRALRRRERVVPTDELVIIKRRTGVALTFGLATMGALALYAFEFRTELAGWWVTFTYVSTAAASSLLCVAVAPTLRAARLRPQIAGDAGDISADLGFRVDAQRFARRVAIGVGLVVWLAGIVQSDPIDGLIRGVFEGLVCFGGFVVLGRYLALRR